MNNKGIIGAIIGDVVGSRFEFENLRSTKFDLFSRGSMMTDDTVMTIAVAEWLIEGGNVAEYLHKWGRLYPGAGYGGMFYRWLFAKEILPAYNSFGNGAGMRVSPCGFYAKTLQEALYLAEQSAIVTHNHPEGVKGAQAIASAIFLARKGKNKEQIAKYIEKTFGYNLNRTCDNIRLTNGFDATCQGTCPEAIIAFLESKDYESAIRLAVSLGGDSDTIACMAGGIAAAYYGVPQKIIEQVVPLLPNDILDIVGHFDARCRRSSRVTSFLGLLHRCRWWRGGQR